MDLSELPVPTVCYIFNSSYIAQTSLEAVFVGSAGMIRGGDSRPAAINSPSLLLERNLLCFRREQWFSDCSKPLGFHPASIQSSDQSVSVSLVVFSAHSKTRAGVA